MKRLLSVTVISIGLITASGCQALYSSKQAGLEQNWGRSVSTARCLQVLNPESGKNLEPVTVIEGPAANAAVDSYYRRFSKKPMAPTYNINLSGIK